MFITGIAISTAAESFLFPLLSVSILFLYVTIIDRKKYQNHFSQNDQLIIECDSIDNSVIEELIKNLNKKGVNVEIQSIRKEKNKSILVLKLSDFSLNDLKFSEKYLNKKNIQNIKIQYFSSPE